MLPCLDLSEWSFPALSITSSLTAWIVRPLLWTIWITGRFSNASGREIASMAGRSPSAVTHVWRELQERLNIDTTFKQEIEALARILETEIREIS